MCQFVKRNQSMNKAFFLDRDGVIIQMVYDLESGYIHTVLNPNQVQFVPGVFELLKETKRLGYKNIVISNQPNIGLKRISRDNFEKVKRKINQELEKQSLTLDGEYYCFHHPFADTKEYRIKCNCRKPDPGLILKAAKEHNVDLKQSFMIGDGVNDVIAGYRAGCKTILIANLLEAEYLRLLEKNLHGIKPDFIVKNLKEVKRIVQTLERENVKT